MGARAQVKAGEYRLHLSPFSSLSLFFFLISPSSRWVSWLWGGNLVRQGILHFGKSAMVNALQVINYKQIGIYSLAWD